MAYQTTGHRMTLPVDGAPATAVGANLIMIASTTGAALSTAGELGFLGVTGDPTDQAGYTTIQLDGIALVNSGGAVNPGDMIASDATGNAVTFTPNVAGGNARQFIGVCIGAGSTGANQLIDVVLHPGICEAA